MNKAIRSIVLLSGLVLAATPLHAEQMSLKQVMEAVLINHPDLALSRVDTAIAETEVRNLEGQLDPVLTARIGASDEKSPVASDFQAAQTRVGQLSGGIEKPLANGGTVGANFTYNRTSQKFTSPLASQLARFNPAYRNQVNLSYRHPLLKGADRPSYHEAMTAAEANIRSSQLQQQVIAYTLSLQVLNAYYQLASDDINISLAEQAIARAKKLLSYQRSREEFGLIERVDRLQAEALLAARRTDLQQARARRDADLTALNRLMRRSPDLALSVQVSPPEEQPLASPEVELEQAETHRPELKALQAQMEAADAQLMLNRSSDKMQLDLVAEIGTRALDGAPLPAAAGGMSVNDRFASLSLEFSDVVQRNSARAAIAKAELSRQRIISERQRTIEQIKDDLASATTAIRTGWTTLATARKQVAAEKRKFTAEMQRYREGRSDTATLVQFEGELRNAELNTELQQLTISLAQQQLVWARGLLLDELGIGLEVIQTAQ